MKRLIVAALFAVLLVAATAEEHHKRCCSSCKASYTHAHHLKHSCLRGCRLYAMIYLAHDKSIADTELAGMCSKSCQTGFSGMLGGADAKKACLTGCGEQERVFKEHGVDSHGAKLTVMHGIGLAPDMRSAAPFHQRIFQQMRELHQRMMKAMSGAKQAVVQRIQIRIHSLPPGPDGKPRYQVEIHQQRLPIVFGRLPLSPMSPNASGGGVKEDAEHRGDHHEHHNHEHHHGGGGDDHDKKMPHHPHHGMHHPGGDRDHDRDSHHHGHGHGHHRVSERDGAGYRVRHFFTDMAEPAKVALRWALCALLLASVLCLGWLCCRTCRRARAAAQNGRCQPLSLTKAFIKKKPCVQSGDIFYVDVDKKPLIENDVLDNTKAKEEEEA